MEYVRRLKKNMYDLMVFLLTILFMSDYRGMFCGAYVGECVGKVTAIQSLINKLKVVGIEIYLLGHNKIC